MAWSRALGTAVVLAAVTSAAVGQTAPPHQEPKPGIQWRVGPTLGFVRVQLGGSPLDPGTRSGPITVNLTSIPNPDYRRDTPAIGGLIEAGRSRVFAQLHVEFRPYPVPVMTVLPPPPPQNGIYRRYATDEPNDGAADQGAVALRLGVKLGTVARNDLVIHSGASGLLSRRKVGILGLEIRRAVGPNQLLLEGQWEHYRVAFRRVDGNYVDGILTGTETTQLRSSINGVSVRIGFLFGPLH